MDTLTHGLAGALLARALPPLADPEADARLRRREAWLGFFAAMFPDADVLASPGSAAFYITQHRGLTHSFPLVPFWALLLGAAALWRLRDVPRGLALWRLTLVAGVGVASHIVLDWITSWGTMFLSPVSWHRFVLDWVFILDGPLSALLALGLLAPFVLVRRPAATRLAARLSLVAAGLYVGFCGLRHHEAMVVLRRLEPPGTLVRAAIPQPLSPNRWLLLADDGTSVHASFVDLSRHGKEALPPLPDSELESIRPSLEGLGRLVARLDAVYRSPDDPGTRAIPKADGPYARRTLDEGRSGIFGRFARFAAARERREPDGRITVVLRDVRFGYLAPAVDPFTYVVTYAADGRVASAGFPSRRWADESRGGAIPAAP